jgi:DNA-binding winged helix-turn-helix (wHTH) protein
LADGRRIRLGGRASDMPIALIEASRAVVSKDELSSRVWQGSIVDQNRQAGTRLPRCAKALAPTAS